MCLVNREFRGAAITGWLQIQKKKIKKFRSWGQGADRPFLGEILVRKGYDVCTVMQVWDGNGGDNQRLESSDAISEAKSAGVVPPGGAHMGEEQCKIQ